MLTVLTTQVHYTKEIFPFLYSRLLLFLNMCRSTYFFYYSFYPLLEHYSIPYIDICLNQSNLTWSCSYYTKYTHTLNKRAGL